MRDAWGKLSKIDGEYHHLAHHSADVAAVLLSLLHVPLFRRRMEAACGESLSESNVHCLAALAFLHDIGKLAPGFQAKGWTNTRGLRPRSHLECGWHWLSVSPPPELAGAVVDLCRWPNRAEWFKALFAHHGRPVAPPLGGANEAFPKVPDYDWRAAETQMGQALLDWLPAIRSSQPPDPKPQVIHYFCGLLTLADWIASDRRAFDFEAAFRPGYWQTATERAERRLAEIGLNASAPALRGDPGWRLISDYPSPRPAQEAVGRLDRHERLILLEAETGSGKTEAALWRFASLVAAGEVDSLYFAVPTRAAARQLQRRVNASLRRMFDPAPEAVLAIPGQVVAGEAAGSRLPDFQVLWDDSEQRPSRWAAEHSARYLAARVAVGTVDQVALGGLQVKFAHLRGAALSRALLVIDEVHASDPYMTEVHIAMARGHLALGGHLMLMSATLGAAARRKWFGHPRGDLAIDSGYPYPALWTAAGPTPIAPDAATAKSVHIAAVAGWSAADAASRAISAARQGARVLVIRNTVGRAQETYASCLRDAPELLLSVDGIPTLHHSRFAAEDRARLDAAVETAVGKESALGGRIVIGTQTLEQSLDLCADLLITDLCPMDVLLQRIGRLHRHQRARPAGFEEARTIVLCPPGGLDPLTRLPENGLGARPDGPDLSGIYVDVPGLAATLAEIESKPLWRIPEMNRSLVEAATHPDALDRIAEQQGWQRYRQRVTGKALADMRTAGLAILDRTAPLECFPSDETIRTRLGQEGVVLSLPEGTIGAFGFPVTTVALPAHWSHGLVGDEIVKVTAGPPTTLQLGRLNIWYGPDGLKSS